MMEDNDKKSSLILLLQGKKPPGMEKEEKDDDDMGEDEKYEAMGQDLLDAIAKKDAKAVGQTLSEIYECLKG